MYRQGRISGLRPDACGWCVEGNWPWVGAVRSPVALDVAREFGSTIEIADRVRLRRGFYFLDCLHACRRVSGDARSCGTVEADALSIFLTT